MEIIENRALLFKTRNPEKYSIIPKSHIVRQDEHGAEVAVYWGLDEARVLRNLGVKNVPSPITKRYDWPGRYKPMAHQIETSAFLTMHRKAFVFSEPGTGKTLSALWAMDYLMKLGKVRRVLILCPLSIMHSAWMQDINNSIIHRSAIIAHHPKASRRIEMIQQDYEIVICNYEGLNLIAEEVKADGRFDLIVVDEANAYKTTTTHRWKVLDKLVTPNTYLWMMTGTPASQSPADAFGLAKLVNPEGVPKFFTGWRDKVLTKVSMYRWIPQSDAREKVFTALQPAIRFTKAQCLDLPPVVTTTREVELTAQQRKYYELLRERMMVQAAGETITAINAAAAVSKLLQVSAGAAYTDDREVVEFDASPRLGVLDEVLEETDRKVLIFALFTNAIETIHKHLLRKGVRAEIIDGSVPASKRANIIHRFQTTPATDVIGPRVLVMQPQASAHGITLTAADTVVFYGPLMSVEQYIQCIARSDRKGQDSDKVTVVHIQSSPIEKRMFKALTDRVSDNVLLTDMFNEAVRENPLA